MAWISYLKCDVCGKKAEHGFRIYTQLTADKSSLCGSPERACQVSGCPECMHSVMNDIEEVVRLRKKLIGLKEKEK